MRRREGTSPRMQQEQEQISQQETMPPVLAEKRKPMKVLVAIDDSEVSFYALKWALDNLFTCEQNSTMLLSCALQISAEQMHADLVVVGSRDLGKIKWLTKITLT
ncbi:hypothetical protein MKW92_008918 [Papaver armeniacum]|nr:hypothetical protein MKW92_008918 [Papaver armeniacum]